MKALLLVFFALFQCASLLADTSPMIRALVVADTLDKSLGEDIKVDVYRMQKNVEIISKKIGCQLNLTTLCDNHFRSDDVIAWLRNLPKVSNDIVIFYYSGHGRRDALTKPWPVLAIWNSEHFPRPLGGAAVINFLKQNTQRLALVLFDCCNKGSDREHISYIPRGKEIMISESIDADGLKKLFLHTRGVIVASAASPGEYSYSHNSVPKGGVFSVSFTKTLMRACKNKNVSWKQVFLRIDHRCAEDTKNSDYGCQHLIYSLHLKK